MSFESYSSEESQTLGFLFLQKLGFVAKKKGLGIQDQESSDGEERVRAIRLMHTMWNLVATLQNKRETIDRRIMPLDIHDIISTTRYYEGKWGLNHFHDWFKDYPKEVNDFEGWYESMSYEDYLSSLNFKTDEKGAIAPPSEVLKAFLDVHREKFSFGLESTLKKVS